MTAESPAETQPLQPIATSRAIGWLLAVLFLILAVADHWIYALKIGTVLRDGGLVDTDSYMRVLKILDLYNGAGWYDTITQRLGAPEGLSLHWTRPVDILILVPALIAHLFGADVPRAVYWIGASFSTIFHILACFAVAWAARPLWRSPGHRFAALILLSNSAAFGYGTFGRADHHTVLLFLTAMMIGAALRAAIADTPVASQRRWAALAGLYAGLGIWVSPEMLVPITPLIGTIGLFWLDAPLDRNSPEEAPRDWAGLGAAFSLPIAAVALVAIPIEQPPAHWLVAEYDKISIPYLVLPLIWTAVFVLARLVRGGIVVRTVAGLLLGGAGLGLLLAMFPNLLFGPLGVDQRLKTDFLDTVREMAPLWPTSLARLPVFLNMAGQSIAALILLPCALIRFWRGERKWAGLLLAMCFGFLLIAAMIHARLSVEFAATPAIICAGFFNLLELKLKDVSRLLRMPALVLTAVALTCGPLIASIAVGMATSGAQPGNSCPLHALADWMNTTRPGVWQSGQPSPIVMTDDISLSPELAFRTDYRFVAGPYHRNPQAIFDTIDAMTAVKPEVTKAILDKRQVSLIVRCTDDVVPRLYTPKAVNFYGALLNGHVPDWLARLTLPKALARHFKVYEVKGR